MVLGPATQRRLCRLRDLLAEPSEARSYRQLADSVGLSPFHAIRQCEALFGQTPHQLRTAFRLAHAQRLLALDAQPVTEVCLAVGYQSLGAFSSLFKRHFGVAPTEWRRRVRTQVPVMGDVRRVVHPGCLELMAWLPAAAFRNFEEA